uniref:Uncharacterized protein n=1 Tax=Oryza glumipatula TaxID=40148 RepID=A0A0E0AA02_9ORYZ
MEWSDEWLAADKLQHVLACFLIALAGAALAGRSSRSPLRRRPAALGCAASLAAGAAKEIADEAGFSGSSGASLRDAAADLVGATLAAVALAILRRLRRPRGEGKARDADHRAGISMSSGTLLVLRLCQAMAKLRPPLVPSNEKVEAEMTDLPVLFCKWQSPISGNYIHNADKSYNFFGRYVYL